ncbi:bifunctional P-loop containing nucleoside triphosphate hydrolase/Adenylate kinase [Babesia duncani]|uniref:Bifunctional P-loop containing nucleoside triphosphate hydrolase/Adenylate kinase n=1 Tax=Babesia duncani TaxID=323732 RepID=A0AAD9PIV4_9APIC|nr:bifunctional P-loop containing nucleoside triphosphate hydrolase/Adenylate kinase [Babesia duncani]
MSKLEDFETAELLKELKRRYNCLGKPEGSFIFMGAPGSGKGTQSQKLKDSHCYCHISTGDLIRNAINSGKPLGLRVKHYLEKGHLVPDKEVLELVEDKISTQQCRRGFILDGFPRTEQQAKDLQKLLSSIGKKVNGVFLFNLPDEEIEKRVTGRRVHPGSGRTYHTIFKPPKVEGRDDITNEPLIHRKDDNLDVVKNRLAVYRKETVPVINHYKNSGLLKEIDASKNEQEINTIVQKIINEMKS